MQGRTHGVACKSDYGLLYDFRGREGKTKVIPSLGKSLGVVDIAGNEGDIAQCWSSGIKNHLGVIVGCRNRGTLIACKVQYLDAERGVGVLSIQNRSTDFPLFAFYIYLIEYQGIQAADADIWNRSESGSVRWSWKLKVTLSPDLALVLSGLLETVETSNSSGDVVNTDKSGIGRVVRDHAPVTRFIFKNDVE